MNLTSCLIAVILAGSLAAQTSSLQDLSKATEQLPKAVIYTAKEVVTLDPDKPQAEAVAVVGDRILAAGSLDELKQAAGEVELADDAKSTHDRAHLVVARLVARRGVEARGRASVLDHVDAPVVVERGGALRDAVGVLPGDRRLVLLVRLRLNLSYSLDRFSFRPAASFLESSPVKKNRLQVIQQPFLQP